MKDTTTNNERFAKMTFASVYPLYFAKIEKKRENPRRVT